MINKKYFLLLLGVLLLGSVFAISTSMNTRGNTYSLSNYKLTHGGEYNDGDTGFDQNMCQEGTDFLIQVDPLSCTPSVVRSDLLEEQDVPVFCKITGLKINPIIDIEYIREMDFAQSDLSLGIRSVSFYPNFNAIFGETDIMNSMRYQDLGYILVHLKRNPDESSMPEYVSGNLTAKLTYDLDDAFGIRDRVFYLPEMGDLEWSYRNDQYSFWDKKGFLRAEGITENSAMVSVYLGNYESAFAKVADRDLQKYAGRNLRVGESFTLNIPGYECLAQLDVRLDALENPETYAVLKVNGEPIQVKQGESFLDGACDVVGIERKGLNQEVSLRCTTDEGPRNPPLRINPEVSIRYSYKIPGGEEKKSGEKGEIFEVGDKIAESYDDKDKFLGSLYLGYLGTGPTGSWKAEDLEAYFIFLPNSREERIPDKFLSYSEVLYDGVTSDQRFERWTKTISGSLFSFAQAKLSGNKYEFSKIGDKKEFWNNVEVEVVGFAGPEDKTLIEIVEANYSFAKKDFSIVYQDFLGSIFPLMEEDKERVETLSEEAFIQKVKLARKLGQDLEARTFCDEYGTYYSESENYFDLCYSFNEFNGGDSYTELLVNGKLKEVFLVRVYEPNFNDYGIKLEIENNTGYSREISLVKGVKYFLNDFGGGGEEYLLLEDGLKLDSAKISGVLYSSGNNEEKAKEGKNLNRFSKTLELNGEWVEEDFTFTLRKINLNKVARVSLNPNLKGAKSQSNFSFSIGIEKRAIQLSPEKTEERIETVNKTISAFEKINAGLGKTVETMKAACIATGLGLTVKNLIENSDGKALARNLAMNNAGGWYERCTDWNDLNKKLGSNYVSKEDCLIENSENVEKSVDKYHEIMENQQEEFRGLAEDEKNILNSDAGFLETKQLNTSAIASDYSEIVKNRIFDCVKDPWTKLGEEEKEICSSNLDISFEAYERGDYTLTELKEIDLYSQILNDGSSDEVSREMAQKELYGLLKGVEKNKEEAEDRVKYSGSFSLDNVFFKHGEGFTQFNVTTLQTFGELGLNGEDNKLTKDTRVVKILEGNEVGYKEYLISYEEGGAIINTYGIVGNSVKKVNEDKTNPLKIRLKINYLELGDGKSTEYKNPEVRYFEEGIYAGLPSIVPLDVKNGWYAYMESGSYKPDFRETYLDSGVINSFYICNVGNNGLEEKGPDNENDADDICTMVNKFAEPIKGYQISGARSLSESSKLVEKATKNILAASRAHEENVKFVPLEIYEAGSSSKNIKVGMPEVNLPDIQCMDLMSPKDCQILFNVCDPVTCHSSRCDYGGKYPVKDVIQSGVIGSVLLCAPNLDEGIYVPVCLSGLHAGLDNWIVTMKGYQNCLQESLDSGRTVGICDQTQSIYLCELFWRELAPFAKITVPKLISKIGSSGAHGGGEYLTFASSWKKAQESVKFFTDFYAADSYKAFKLRSTNEVGGLFCKSYASVVYPSGANLLEALIAPDSPEHFTGYFDEIPFTTVTNPPISHYKVFYQIYAGNDQGAYYRVYLRQGGSGSYYQDGTAGKLVDSDYLAPGEFIQESKDFTSPSGYKELCISVNGQEDCNFGKVSTSFAVDLLSDEYVKKQVNTTSVTTTEECVSGSFNLLNLLNLNVQEGIDNLIDPQIYQNGIIRICANENPGVGTDNGVGTSRERWQDVGYCGNPDMRCWIDKSNLENIFEFEYTKNQTMEALLNKSREKAMTDGNYMDVSQFKNFVDDLEGKEVLETIRIINENMGRVFLGNQKGYLYLLRGKAYGKLAKENYYYWQLKEKLRKMIEAGINVEEMSEDDIFNYELDPEDFSASEEEYIFSSPKFELNIGGKKDLCLKYVFGSWQWSPNPCRNAGDIVISKTRSGPGFGTTSEYNYTDGSRDWFGCEDETTYLERRSEDQFLIKNLCKSSNFRKGFELLLLRALKENGLSSFSGKTRLTTMDDKGVFSFKQEDSENLKLKYSEDLSSWMWTHYVSPSLDGAWVDLDSFTHPVTNVILTLKQRSFLEGLGVLNFVGGSKTLFWKGSSEELFIFESDKIGFEEEESYSQESSFGEKIFFAAKQLSEEGYKTDKDLEGSPGVFYLQSVFREAKNIDPYDFPLIMTETMGKIKESPQFREIDLGDLQEGDLVFFERGSSKVFSVGIFSKFQKDSEKILAYSVLDRNDRAKVREFKSYSGGISTKAHFYSAYRYFGETGMEETNYGEKIYQTAKELVDSGHNQERLEEGNTFLDNPCAAFVTHVLAESGLPMPEVIEKESGFCSGIDYLNNLFGESFLFEKVADYNSPEGFTNLKKGDVLIFGYRPNDPDKTQHSSIFSHYSLGGSQAFVFSDAGEDDKTDLDNYPLDGVKWYGSYAWRYVGGGSLGKSTNFENFQTSYDSLILSYSKKYNLDPSLVRAVIKQESNFNPYAVSSTGCVGLMQFCDSTAEDFKYIFEVVEDCSCEGVCTASCTKEDIEDKCSCDIRDGRFDAEKSIEAGSKYLSSLISRYRNYDQGYSIQPTLEDYILFAIAAYNGGMGLIDEAIIQTELAEEEITWDNVKNHLNEETFRQFRVYSSWSDIQVENKRKEIIRYVDQIQLFYGSLGNSEDIFNLGDSENDFTSSGGLAGKYQVISSDYPEEIHISNDYGDTWTVEDVNKAWGGISISSDGKYQTVIIWNGKIYISNDYGNTWIEKESDRYWSDISISSDGKYQTAVVSGNGGKIYISNDYGNTWIEKESNREWKGISISSDGKYQTAVSYGGKIYISNDYGNTWIEKESDRYWRDISISSDGKYQTAVVYEGKIYVSNDYGNTWTEKESDGTWQGISISSDGKYQTAITLGKIYISSDYGNTWIAKGESSGAFRSVSISSGASASSGFSSSSSGASSVSLTPDFGSALNILNGLKTEFGNANYGEEEEVDSFIDSLWEKGEGIYFSEEEYKDIIGKGLRSKKDLSFVVSFLLKKQVELGNYGNLELGLEEKKSFLGSEIRNWNPSLDAKEYSEALLFLDRLISLFGEDATHKDDDAIKDFVEKLFDSGLISSKETKDVLGSDGFLNLAGGPLTLKEIEELLDEKYDSLPLFSGDALGSEISDWNPSEETRLKAHNSAIIFSERLMENFGAEANYKDANLIKDFVEKLFDYELISSKETKDILGKDGFLGLLQNPWNLLEIRNLLDEKYELLGYSEPIGGKYFQVVSSSGDSLNNQKLIVSTSLAKQRSEVLYELNLESYLFKLDSLTQATIDSCDDSCEPLEEITFNEFFYFEPSENDFLEVEVLENPSENDLEISFEESVFLDSTGIVSTENLIMKELVVVEHILKKPVEGVKLEINGLEMVTNPEGIAEFSPWVFGDFNPNFNTVVVLDPGHGGNDPGAIAADGTYEKDWTLNFALELKEALEKKGYPVLLTRNSDREVNYREINYDDNPGIDSSDELLARVNFAQVVDADYFLSIHFNSNKDSNSLEGIEVYIDALAKVDSINNGKLDSCELSSCYSYSKEDLPFAERMKNELSSVSSTKIFGADMRVLTEKPAKNSVLLEVNYLNNPEVVKILKDPAIFSRYVESVANSFE